MSGVTETGFERETFDSIASKSKAAMRAKVDERLVLDETTPEGNIVDILCGRLAYAWEAIEQAYGALDPDAATGDALVSIALLRGVPRRTVSRAVLVVTCTLAIGTYPAGQLVVANIDSPSIRWYNPNEVIVTSAGARTVTFVAETAGSVPTVTAHNVSMAVSVSGWTAADNAAASTPGYDLESIEALRDRSRREIYLGGSSTLASIVAAVSNVDGVVDATGEENTTGATVDSIPAHGVWINVWDNGGAAVDADIAAAILSKLPGGTPTAGGDSAIVTTEDGRSVTVYFNRVTAVPLTIAVSVTGGSIDAVKDALVAAQDPSIGVDASFFRLAAAPFDATGVTGVTAFTLNAGSSDVTIDKREVATLDPDDITVTVT